MLCIFYHNKNKEICKVTDGEGQRNNVRKKKKKKQGWLDVHGRTQKADIQSSLENSFQLCCLYVTRWGKT